jgi:hypothetical protein
MPLASWSKMDLVAANTCAGADRHSYGGMVWIMGIHRKLQETAAALGRIVPTQPSCTSRINELALW